jgi:hypothetical protein
MKNTIRIVSCLALGAIASSALAQPNPPTPRAAPPAPPIAPGQIAPPAPPKREPVMFLGVVAVPPSAALIDQLGLQPGFGLVVESVTPNSPADQAGIKKYDLLMAFGDQKLASPSQLSALVRSTNEGSDVVLTVMRKGQQSKVTAKITKRVPEGGRNWGGYIREMMKQSGLPQGWSFNMNGDDENGKHITIRRPGDGGNARTTTVDMNRARIIIRDDMGEIEVGGEPGKRTLTARKPDGTVIFSGPINTDEERKSVPPELMDKLKKLERDRDRSTTFRMDSKRDRDNDNDADDENFEFDFDIGGNNFAPIPPIPPIPPVPPVPPIAPVGPEMPSWEDAGADPAT